MAIVYLRSEHFLLQLCSLLFLHSPKQPNTCFFSAFVLFLWGSLLSLPLTSFLFSFPFRAPLLCFLFAAHNQCVQLGSQFSGYLPVEWSLPTKSPEYPVTCCSITQFRLKQQTESNWNETNTKWTGNGTKVQLYPPKPSQPSDKKKKNRLKGRERKLRQHVTDRPEINKM